MPIASILEQLLIALAEDGLAKLLPVVIAKVPAGLAQTIAKEALASAAVQEWIAKGETAAADEAVKLASQAWVALKAFFEAHVSKSIAAAVESVLPSQVTLHLTADEVKLFAADVVAGKWSQVLAAAEAAIGLAPAP